jgi:hypothetical protein
MGLFIAHKDEIHISIQLNITRSRKAVSILEWLGELMMKSDSFTPYP